MEDVLPDALVCPANEPVVERFPRAVDRGRIHPAAARFQDMHNPADNASVVHPGLAAGICWKMRLKPRELLVRQPENVRVHPMAPFGSLESENA